MKRKMRVETPTCAHDRRGHIDREALKDEDGVKRKSMQNFRS